MCTFSTFRAGFYLVFKTGLCATVVQVLAAYTVQSMHAGIQHLCVLYMTSHTMNSIKFKSRFCKPWLLFKSGLCVGMQLQKCGFYSRAASAQGWLLHKTLRCMQYASPANNTPFGAATRQQVKRRRVCRRKGIFVNETLLYILTLVKQRADSGLRRSGHHVPVITVPLQLSF